MSQKWLASLSMCAIRLEGKMQGGGQFNQGGSVILLGGANFQAKGQIFATGPGWSYLTKGQHFKWAMLFCDTDTRRRDYEIHGGP